MSKTRDRSPLKRETNSINSDFTNSNSRNINNNTMATHTATEINLAKDMIPKYDGGDRKLSHFILQCEKFISMFRNNTPGQEGCTLNVLLFEICCSKLEGEASDTLVTSNCTTWTQVKEILTNRFGDPRNESLLANDLTTCFQSHNESYENYFANIKFKLQKVLEHIAIREANEDIKNFKINSYAQSALNTFKAGLLEPYRSHVSIQPVGSIEDCLLILRNYDNQRQQTEFLNFIRNKTPLKQNMKTNANINKSIPKFNNQNLNRNNFYPNYNDNGPFNSNFNNHSNFSSNFNNNSNFNPNFNNNSNFRPNFNSSYNNQNFNSRRNSNQSFPRSQTQFTPAQNRYNNSQIHQRNQSTEPTPMSISTRNTFSRPNNSWTQNRSRNFNNHFTNRGPSNFISEELHNIQYPELSQRERSEDQRENDDSTNEIENFRVEASEEQ